MSFYRNLTVNDKEYQYHIGKDFVKIKGVPGNNNIPKAEVGITFWNEVIVTPGMIRDYILGKNPSEGKIEDYFEHACSCTGVDKFLRADPYDAEVHGIFKRYIWCDACYEQKSWDI